MLQEDKLNSWTGQTAKLATDFGDDKMQSAQLCEEHICGAEQNHSKIMDLMFFLCDRLLHFAPCCCMSMDLSALWFIVSYRTWGCILIWPLTPILPGCQKVFQVSRAACHAGNCSFHFWFSSTVQCLFSLPVHNPKNKNGTCRSMAWQCLHAGRHVRKPLLAGGSENRCLCSTGLCVPLYTAWAYALI